MPETDCKRRIAISTFEYMYAVRTSFACCSSTASRSSAEDWRRVNMAVGGEGRKRGELRRIRERGERGQLRYRCDGTMVI